MKKVKKGTDFFSKTGDIHDGSSGDSILICSIHE